MEPRKAVNEMIKYIAQAKELMQKYLEDNDIENDSYLEEAIKLLNIALDNIVV